MRRYKVLFAVGICGVLAGIVIGLVGLEIINAMGVRPEGWQVISQVFVSPLLMVGGMLLALWSSTKAWPAPPRRSTSDEDRLVLLLRQWVSDGRISIVEARRVLALAQCTRAAAQPDDFFIAPFIG